MFIYFVWAYVVILATSLEKSVEAKASYQILGKGIKCASKSPLVGSSNCSMTESNGTSFFSIDVYFKDDVVLENLHAKFTWNYKTSNDFKFRPFLGLANLSMNLCSYLENGNSMLVDIFLDDLKKHSNLIHSCPFKGHCYIKDVSPNVKRFPPIIPHGTYVMWIVFYTKINDSDHEVMDLKMYADVKTIR